MVCKPRGCFLVSNLLLWLFIVPCLTQAQTVITRVEPPNWWIGHSLNPVRLLITGTNLNGATIQTDPTATTSNLRVQADGRHAFVDLTIPRGAAPGTVNLKLVTRAGADTIRFLLLPPPERRDRFAGFSPDDVIYLLMPDRFANGDKTNDDPGISRGMSDRSKPRYYHGGDFSGIKAHLPYLRDLGVTALWLTPWYDNVNHPNTKEKYTRDNQRSTSGIASTDYHGYGAVDFYSVEEHFGDLAELRGLVDAAHTTGLKVIQDQVANHTGPYHPWVNNAPTPTWFNGTAANHLGNGWQTWTIANTNPPRDKLRATLDGWFINILPDLNQNDPETASYLIQNSLWWIGTAGLDAVRQDTLPFVPRTYWARWTTALKREYPHLTILGEMWDAKPEMVSFFQGGRARFDGVDSGVDTLFDFPLHYAIRDVFAKKQPATRLAQVLASDNLYVNPRVLVTSLGLHDTPRFMSEPGATIDGLKLAFTFLLTVRGTPLIYYGDEIAMRGGGDPENRRDFPGGWPEDAHNAFDRSGRTTEEEQVHAHITKLLSLRQKLAPLRTGEFVQLHVDDSAYAFARVTSNSVAVVALNNGPQPRTLRLAADRFGGVAEFIDQLGKLGRVAVKAGTVTVTLAGCDATLLTTDGSDFQRASGFRQGSDKSANRGQ